MGKQSSRLYYNGKDHKDIYYNGKYHNAMYFKDQGGYIWRKLFSDNDVTFSMVNTKKPIGNYTDIGINAVYPSTETIDANVVKSYSYYYGNGDECFDTIVVGIKRCYGFLKNDESNNRFFNTVWVSSDGKYWKKVKTGQKVTYIYPYIDGFLYVTNDNSLIKVQLDDDNSALLQTLIYSGSTIKEKSINGAWRKTTNIFYFVTQAGNQLSIDFGEPIYADMYFTDLSKSYIIARTLAYRYYLVATDGTEITKQEITELYQNYGTPQSIYEYAGAFYFNTYQYNEDYQLVGMNYYRTQNFADVNLIANWGIDEYVDLRVLGGTYGDIETVRFYPCINPNYYMDDNYNSYAYAPNNKDLQVWIKKYQNIDVPYFVGNVSVQSPQILTQVSTVANLTSNLVIYLSSKIIDKNISGFCYFTENIGVGVSYP